MNILKAYSSGFRNSLRRPKMIFLIYAICLLLGLSLALPFFFSFQSASSSSIISKTLDWTAFTELMNFHSWNLDSIFHQGVFTVFVYWLIMIFFVGGIIRCFNKEDYTTTTFFSGAGVNFLRFLLCDILMILAQIVMFFVLFGLASLLLQLFGNITSEGPLYWAYSIAAFIYACVVVLLLMISDYAKFYMEMAETHRVLKAIGKAVKYVFNNFVKTYFLYALLLVVPFFTLVLYKMTFDKIGTASTWGLIIMFFVQQFFIVLRIWYRIWSLSSQFEMYADDYVKVSSFDLEILRTVEETTQTVTTQEVIDDTATLISKDLEADKIIVEISNDDVKKEDTSDEKEPEYDNLIVKVEPEPQTTTTTTTETVVINDSGDTFTTVTTTTTTVPKEDSDPLMGEKIEPEENSSKAVESSSETVENSSETIENTSEIVENTSETIENTSAQEEYSSENLENNSSETIVMEEKVSEDQEQKKSDEEQEVSDEKTQILVEETKETEDDDDQSDFQSDEVDENLLEQYYDNHEDSKAVVEETEEEELPGYNPDEQDDYVESDGEETPDFEIDTAMGANISLDEDEDDIVTTVTTTTTTTTTTATTTEEENSSDAQERKEPKIIKIYTGLQDDDDNQLNNSQMEQTEVVSEDALEGEPSFEQHQDEQFVKQQLPDGEPEGDDLPAQG